MNLKSDYIYSLTLVRLLLHKQYMFYRKELNSSFRLWCVRWFRNGLSNFFIPSVSNHKYFNIVAGTWNGWGPVEDHVWCKSRRNWKLRSNRPIINFIFLCLISNCTTTRLLNRRHLDTSQSKGDRKQVACDTGWSCNIHQVGEREISSENIIF